jgi:hypothetical protein
MIILQGWFRKQGGSATSCSAGTQAVCSTLRILPSPGEGRAVKRPRTAEPRPPISTCTQMVVAKDACHMHKGFSLCRHLNVAQC